MKHILNVKQRLHILVDYYKEDRRWCAHCLDMHVTADGKTKEDAVKTLFELIQTQIEYCVEHKMLDSIFSPAPKEYWEMIFGLSMCRQREKNLALPTKIFTVDVFDGAPRF